MKVYLISWLIAFISVGFGTWFTIHQIPEIELDRQQYYARVKAEGHETTLIHYREYWVSYALLLIIPVGMLAASLVTRNEEIRR